MVFKDSKFVPLSQSIVCSDSNTKEIGYIKHIDSREFDCYYEDALEIIIDGVKEDYDLLISTIDDDCDWGILFRNGFCRVKIDKNKDQLFWAKKGSSYYDEYLTLSQKTGKTGNCQNNLENKNEELKELLRSIFIDVEDSEDAGDSISWIREILKNNPLLD